MINVAILNESVSQLNEGVLDIIPKIKAYFKQKKDDKKIKTILDKVHANGGTIDAYFDELVPATGKADTVAGELIRAINKIQYRWYNDGDCFGFGYGLEVCGGAAQFIENTLGNDNLLLDCLDGIDPDYVLYNEKAFEKQYEKVLTKLTDAVLEYISNNPETLITNNDIDMNDVNYDKLIENEIVVDEYSFDIDYPTENGDNWDDVGEAIDMDLDDIAFEIAIDIGADESYVDVEDAMWGVLTVRVYDTPITKIIEFRDRVSSYVSSLQDRIETDYYEYLNDNGLLDDDDDDDEYDD